VSESEVVARSALHPFVQAGRHGNLAAAPGVILSERAGLGIVSVIARKGKADAASAAALAACGVALPLTPRRAEARGIAFIWTGPERWLAVTQNRGSEDLAKMFAGIFSGLASIAEQGDGRTIIRIAGPRARDVLAKGLAIDLHPRAFRPGDTAITGAVHVEVQIWQLDDTPTYEIALFRGFAGSFWQWLTQAAAEYGYHVAPAG
jgi:heterotetrameric sarcosine oxidase gamma subunit